MGCRVLSALRRACSVQSPVQRGPIAQPTTAREDRSRSTARYSQPARVPTSVISSAQTRVGCRTVNGRSRVFAATGKPCDEYGVARPFFTGVA